MREVSVVFLSNITLFVTFLSLMYSDNKVLCVLYLSTHCVCVCVFQGDIVNNIEVQVSKAVDHIVVAKTETKKAIQYQSKARKVLHPVHQLEPLSA